MDDLYQEVLLDHVKSPLRVGKLGEGAHHIELHNPLCGDEVEFWIEVTADRITKVRFLARGCFISRAAASLAANCIEGKGSEEALAVIRSFRASILGEELTPQQREDLGELVALEGVRQYPTRVKCALLAFEALEKGTPRKSEA